MPCDNENVLYYDIPLGTCDVKFVHFTWDTILNAASHRDDNGLTDEVEACATGRKLNRAKGAIKMLIGKIM